MGWWSRVKSYFSKPKASSAPPAAATPAPRQTTTITKVSPTKRSVVVTDYTTGESVKTTTITPSRSGGGGGGGTTTTQTYTPAPAQVPVSQQLGKTQAIAVASSPGTLASSVRGSTIQPGDAPGVTSMQPYTYTGKIGERYERPLSSAIIQSGRGILNVGIIGQQGIKAYTEQAFFKPFRDVGKSKAYREVGYDTAPPMRGTEIGYNLPESERVKLLPPGYADTSKDTYYDVSERQKAELYRRSGLPYTGEAAAVLPQRITEDVVKQLSPEYEEKLSGRVKTLRGSYQARIDTGDITLEQAKTRFQSDINKLTQGANIEFEKEATQLAGTRIRKVAGGIDFATRYESKIYESPADPIIRGTGTAIKVGALVGATTFGGSIPTIAAATYLGARTQKDVLDYSLQYGKLTTGQKIVGAGSIAITGAAAYYTGRLGMSKYYSEWRGIIYSDLAAKRGITTGKLLQMDERGAVYGLKTTRTRGAYTSLTSQKVAIAKTGQRSFGFRTSGKTRTRIFDPETERFITTTQSFKTGGKIPAITEGITIKREGSRIFYPDVTGSYGSGFYYAPGSKPLKEFSFIGASKETKRGFIVAGGKGIGSARRMPGASSATAYGSRVSTAGFIRKDKALIDESTRWIPGSGTKSSDQYFKQLYGLDVGGSAAGIGTTTQQIGLKNLATKGIQGGVGAAAIVGTSQAVRAASTRLTTPTTTAASLTPQRVRTSGVQIPTTSQLGLTRQRLDSGVRTRSLLGSATSPAFSITPTQIQPQAQITGQAPVLGLAPIQTFKPGLISPVVTQGFTPGFDPLYQGGFIPPPFFALAPGGLGLGAKSIRGGRRVTQYSPSFSALLFNIRGKAPKTTPKTGIGFRPITKGFKFKTGLDFAGLKF